MKSLRLATIRAPATRPMGRVAAPVRPLGGRPASQLAAETSPRAFSTGKAAAPGFALADLVTEVPKRLKRTDALPLTVVPLPRPRSEARAGPAEPPTLASPRSALGARDRSLHARVPTSRCHRSRMSAPSLTEPVRTGVATKLVSTPQVRIKLAVAAPVGPPSVAKRASEPTPRAPRATNGQPRRIRRPKCARPTPKAPQKTGVLHARLAASARYTRSTRQRARRRQGVAAELLAAPVLPFLVDTARRAREAPPVGRPRRLITRPAPPTDGVAAALPVPPRSASPRPAPRQSPPE